MKTRKFGLALVTAAALALSACTSSVPAKKAEEPAKEEKKAEVVKVVTNGSFTLPDDVLAEFTKKSGFKVELLNGEESGTLESKIILTKNKPVGDVVIGLTANNVAQVAAELASSIPQSRLLGQQAQISTPLKALKARSPLIVPMPASTTISPTSRIRASLRQPDWKIW